MEKIHNLSVSMSLQWIPIDKKLLPLFRKRGTGAGKIPVHHFTSRNLYNFETRRLISV